MLSPSLATSVDWTVPDGAELKLSTVMEALTYNHVDDAENPGDTIVVDSNGWKVGIKTRPSMNCFSSQDQQCCHDWMSRAWTSVLWFRCWNSVLLLSPTGGSGTPRDLWCKTDRRYMFRTKRLAIIICEYTCCTRLSRWTLLCFYLHKKQQLFIGRSQKYPFQFSNGYNTICMSCWYCCSQCSCKIQLESIIIVPPLCLLLWSTIGTWCTVFNTIRHDSHSWKPPR